MRKLNSPWTGSSIFFSFKHKLAVCWRFTCASGGQSRLFLHRIFDWLEYVWKKEDWKWTNQCKSYKDIWCTCLSRPITKPFSSIVLYTYNIRGVFKTKRYSSNFVGFVYSIFAFPKLMITKIKPVSLHSTDFHFISKKLSKTPFLLSPWREWPYPSQLDVQE